MNFVHLQVYGNVVIRAICPDLCPGALGYAIVVDVSVPPPKCLYFSSSAGAILLTNTCYYLLIETRPLCQWDPAIQCVAGTPCLASSRSCRTRCCICCIRNPLATASGSMRDSPQPWSLPWSSVRGCHNT